MKLRASPATLIASVALFFSLTGAGLAASHYLITSVKQIKPSVRDQLRGATGPRGPAGPAGAADSSGPDSNATVVVQGTSVQVPPGTSGTSTAACTIISYPKMTGGGFTATQGANVYSSYPTNGMSGGVLPMWSVSAYNPTGSTITLTAWASCIVSN